MRFHTTNIGRRPNLPSPKPSPRLQLRLKIRLTCEEISSSTSQTRTMSVCIDLITCLHLYRKPRQGWLRKISQKQIFIIVEKHRDTAISSRYFLK